MKQKEIGKNMEERAEKLNEILKRQNQEFRVRYCRNWKNNIAYHGYMLHSNNRNVKPVIYTNCFNCNSDWYKNTDLEVVEFLSKKYKELSTEASVSFEYLKNKKFILDRIRPRLVGSEKNIDELLKAKKAFVELDNLDMLITFYIYLGENEEGEANIPVTNDLLEEAEGITLEEAKSYAISNMEKLACVNSMGEVLNELIGMDYSTEAELMLICSNESRCNGAASILCPSVQDKLKDRLGNNVILLPSSVHEMIAISTKNNIYEVDALQAMVQEINEDQVALEDQLTNSVYMLRDGLLERIS